MTASAIGSSLLLAGVAFAVLGLILFSSALVGLATARVARFAALLTCSLCLLTLAAATGALAVGLEGFRLISEEEPAARIVVEPAGPQRFTATVHFPDGRALPFDVSGDELYVDAHVLKWKPFAQLLGLHTAYELDRLGGRYRDIQQERSATRSIYPLSRTRWVDVFELRQRYALLEPLLDAEYGSATFASIKRPATLEVRVSATGLLIRDLTQPAANGRPQQP